MSLIRNRMPHYGELDTKNLHPEVKAIWYSKDKELPELIFPPTSSEIVDCVEQYEIKQFKKIIWDLLDILTDVEKKILLSRILNKDITRKDIGKKMNMSEDKVIYIEKMALNKLRNPLIIDKLYRCVPDIFR